MKFHTPFNIKKLPQPIKHTHALFLIGSCFTENIGDKLRHAKFKVHENPAGILFNPVSVVETVIDCIDNKVFSIEDLFQYNEGWHSWKHHSRFSDASPDAALHKINTAITEGHKALKEAEYLFLTLGSAWVYALTERAPNAVSVRVAANNHKAPADWFNRGLLSTEQVLQQLDTLIHRLSAFNPYAKIIFTISPVRHLREGAVENNRSKAVLINAVHQVVDKWDRLYYFPAYELVIDDLRDYRFYSEDLVHPNYAATQYVWEKFIEACMDDTTKSLIEEIKGIQLAFQHKPFNYQSAQHQKFLHSFYAKTKAVQAQHPYIDLKRELLYFSNPPALK